ncbi:hypothetical protein [Flavobacterium oreochromis]|uniref:Uncharacterized protein n=1 Tax=Flavobacterium columnare TaxID=996 RepID=A0A246GDD9_9FLAO|nr:hypothetical protein [Flavobacterium oreochromis]OWP79302.1 hypothetical protein BWK62_03125 [Flavobacterium oreochromis]
MTRQYEIYEIKPNTIRLQQLAKILQRSPEELRWFHNNYCPLSDLIDPEIQSHVKEIYIPILGTKTHFYAENKINKPFYDKVMIEWSVMVVLHMKLMMF